MLEVFANAENWINWENHGSLNTVTEIICLNINHDKVIQRQHTLEKMLKGKADLLYALFVT